MTAPVRELKPNIVQKKNWKQEQVENADYIPNIKRR